MFNVCSNSNANNSTLDSSNYKTSNDQPHKKILLELFTSQGCSSCPSADKLLGELIQQDTNIVALSFHVDYWNRLGWKDPFSNKAYSQRQSFYARAMKLQSVYTPQLIIQGRYEMVGSQRLRIQQTIKQVKTDAEEVSMVSVNVQNNKNKIAVSYSLSEETKNYQVVAAMIYDKAVTQVANGENGGATLTNYNIVKQFQQLPAKDKEGIFTFAKVDDETLQHSSVIVFLQNPVTGAITEVNQLKL
jgi:hypothetical protein